MRKILSLLVLYMIVLTNTVAPVLAQQRSTFADRVAREAPKSHNDDEAGKPPHDDVGDDDDDVPCRPGTFDFTGNSPNDGSDGNVRTFTVNGVTASVNAFSLRKNNFRLETAYLGLFPDGLGVTNRGEGNGSSNRHTLRPAQF